jgi:hypothetical protein
MIKPELGTKWGARKWEAILLMKKSWVLPCFCCIVLVFIVFLHFDEALIQDWLKPESYLDGLSVGYDFVSERMAVSFQAHFRRAPMQMAMMSRSRMPGERGEHEGVRIFGPRDGTYIAEI